MMMMISVFFATLLLSLDAVNFGFDGRFVRVEWMFLCQSERERETSFVVCTQRLVVTLVRLGYVCEYVRSILLSLMILCYFFLHIMLLFGPS